jgi:methylmalonyl-CoA/ethylmalonyl-CoA epimerase
MRVNHLAIAVRDTAAALAFFRRHFPIVMMNEQQLGHTRDYTWADFHVGTFKLEIIQSAAPGSFVERFIAKRGEGLHHLSIEAPEFDETIARLERDRIRIVDRFEQDGAKTAFISPRSAFGTLIQFWNHFEPEPAHPTVALHKYAGETVRVRVNHVAIAVRDLDAALRFFEGVFPVRRGRPAQVGYEPSFRLTNFYVGDYKIELIAPNVDGRPGFLDRFFAKRGEGFHHVSIDVDRIAPVLEALERDGIRVTDRGRAPDGRETAFISPRAAFGVLIQFWEHPELAAEPAA